MNYYCLIAGLPDIEFEDHKLLFTIANFKEEVRPQLSKKDAKLLDLFYMKFDNKNLLSYLKNKEGMFDERGNLSKEDLETCLQLINEDLKIENSTCPAYFQSFVQEYKEAHHKPTEAALWEDRLAGIYYQWAMSCGNKFISSWFEYNLNLNNILAAYTCRKYQMEVKPVGNNEVAEAIKASSQRDFGLTGTLEDFVQFQHLADIPDLFERERKTDLLKWHWLDEQTFYNFFSIEKLFAYLIKLEMIERWTQLDPTEGERVFRELIDRLKAESRKNNE